MLGEGGSGGLVSAVSAASAPYPGVKQRCWRPRLAASKELGKQHPTDAGVQGWAKGGRARWERASGACPLPAYRDAQPQREAQEWRVLWAPYLGEQETAPQAVLCRRVEQYRSALFVCVGTPLVPATNTAAERSLRPPVIARKIRGGQAGTGGAGDHDDLGEHLRHLASAGAQPRRRVPPSPRRTQLTRLTLNSNPA